MQHNSLLATYTYYTIDALCTALLLLRHCIFNCYPRLVNTHNHKNTQLESAKSVQFSTLDPSKFKRRCQKNETPSRGVVREENLNFFLIRSAPVGDECACPLSLWRDESASNINPCTIHNRSICLHPSCHISDIWELLQPSRIGTPENPCSINTVYYRNDPQSQKVV